MTLTPEHLTVLGIVIVVAIGGAFLWWLVRATIARPKRSRTAYWLDDRHDDHDEDDGGEIHFR